MDVLGEQCEKTLHTRIELAPQLVLDAFAHHRALLARNVVEVALDVRVDRLAESDVQIVVQPVRMPELEIAVLQMIDSQAFGQRAGGFIEGAPCALALRRHPTVDAKRQRYERMPEKQALHLGERQHTLDAAAGLGVEKVRGVPERLLDDALPACAMKKGGFAAARHELVPAGNVSRLQVPYLHRAFSRGARRSRGRHRIKRELVHGSPPGKLTRGSCPGKCDPP